MSKHTMTVTVPMGDPDLGAGVDLKITFSYLAGSAPQLWGDAPHPGDDPSIHFVSVVGPLDGDSYDDMRQSSYNDLAEAYLESDDGCSAAFEEVAADDEAAREYAAESRVDR
jgi:hypothetical protein